MTMDIEILTDEDVDQFDQGGRGGRSAGELTRAAFNAAKNAIQAGQSKLVAVLGTDKPKQAAVESFRRGARDAFYLYGKDIDGWPKVDSRTEATKYISAFARQRKDGTWGIVVKMSMTPRVSYSGEVTILQAVNS